ncbi:hypothetical protein [Paraprevotella clara]|uniref:Uncharacterized protein n=1 Tax=Paraprevotella clara YIT 11840 TaxID=762968 RepID=G5SSD9_9BACT|nr:hypothetical protein [Paraprevotella clara]EHG99857.1 hypothetical protein HMPREF9441_02289 [Paraprevotella clara YIT 11840]
MKKLTLKDLQSLAHVMAHVSEMEQRCFVGGGTDGNYIVLGEVAHRNIPITVKMPVGTFDTSQKLLMLIPGWGIAISYVIGVTDTMIGY